MLKCSRAVDPFVRLRVSRPEADERLHALIAEGYRIRAWLDEEQARSGRATHALKQARIKFWFDRTNSELLAIFPTDREMNEYSIPLGPPPTHVTTPNTDLEFLKLKVSMDKHLPLLVKIQEEALDRYADLPQSMRLHVEDVDSFHLVRSVNPHEVEGVLVQGRIELAEDDVQKALEEILGVPMHKKDWGGEYNDLYASNIVVNGQRVTGAFLLKGKGLTNKVMEIAHCGKNGDQLVRLAESPATVLVVQYVGNISEQVVKDIESKVRDLRSQGRDAHYLILDGQDTARLLRAYGKI